MVPSVFRFPLPLRTKAILLVIVWQVGAFTAFSALKTLTEYRGARTMLTEATRLSARCIGHACSMSLESEGMAVLGKILAVATKEHGEDLRYLFVVSTDGRFLAGVPSEDPALAARVEKIPAHHDLRELDDPVRYRGAFLDFSVPVMVANRSFGVLHVGVGDQNIRHRLLQSLRQDVLIIFLALICGGLIALFIDLRLKGSLRSLLHITRQMSHGDLSQRVDIRTGDELQTLGESFNQMADALAKSRAELEEKVRDRTAELRQEQEKLSGIVEGMGVGLVLVDRNRRVLWSNRRAHQLLGHEDSRSLRVCYASIWGEPSSCPNCPVSEAIQTGLIVRHEREIRQSGIRRYFSVTASPIRDGDGNLNQAIELIEDITERKEMEARLIQTDKMAGIGRLASGVAHELGNPLGSIYLQAKLIQEDAGCLPDALKRIEADVNRCRSIIRDLSEFSRMSCGEREIHSATGLVQDSLTLCRHILEKHRIEVRADFDPRPPQCSVDPNKLKQVFVNLIQNAAQAMPGGGRLSIAIRRKEDEVEIEFGDSGPGIPADIRRKIFEPFFTTKSDGTGLGLSICHRIIEEHGGRIEVESSHPAEAGHGTAFRVTLPTTDKRS